MNLQSLRHRGSGFCERPSAPRAALLAACWLILLPSIVLGSPQAPQDPANANPSSAGPAAVEHVKLLLEQGNPALEIETTVPVTPQINKSNEGMRLVIDLPNTDMSVTDKVVPIKNRDLSEMRLNIVGSTPPAVHVEIDFRKPLAYAWDAEGNRLLITFHEPDKNELGNSDASAAGPVPLPVSAPAAPPEFTHMVPAETLASGASITAGAETTVLRLRHAGDVYVCPQTSVSVVHSKNGPDVMLAMNDGGLETHLALRNSADEVVTPDFRILLRGPGEFHYAIRSDSRGNTCVRTLPGNTAPAIIYELMGDGTYNVQAQDELIFQDGKLIPGAAASQFDSSGHAVLPVECGCPPPARSTLLASTKGQPRIAVEMASPDPSPAGGRSDPGPGTAKEPGASTNPASPETAAEIRDLPQTVREQPHLAVEASLSFRPNPARIAASHLPATSRQASSPVAVLPPAPAPERHKSFFGKIKSFFSRAF